MRGGARATSFGWGTLRFHWPPASVPVPTPCSRMQSQQLIWLLFLRLFVPFCGYSLNNASG